MKSNLALIVVTVRAGDAGALGNLLLSVGKLLELARRLGAVVELVEALLIQASAIRLATTYAVSVSDRFGSCKRGSLAMNEASKFGNLRHNFIEKDSQVTSIIKNHGVAQIDHI